MKSIEDIKNEIVYICRRSYAINDVTGYSMIEKLVEGVEGDFAESIRRFAQAGPTLISSRFAYTHIESLILD